MCATGLGIVAGSIYQTVCVRDGEGTEPERGGGKAEAEVRKTVGTGAERQRKRREGRKALYVESRW